MTPTLSIILFLAGIGVAASVLVWIGTHSEK